MASAVMVNPLFFAADSTCYMAALHFTTVAHVVVMLSLTPLFAALAAWVAMREAIRLPVAIAMFLAFAGVAIGFFIVWAVTRQARRTARDQASEKTAPHGLGSAHDCL